MLKPEHSQPERLQEVNVTERNGNATKYNVMLDLNKISTYSLKDRFSKVEVKDFAKPISESTARNTQDWFNHFPQILAAKELKEFVLDVKKAKDRKKPIIWGMGSHVLKTGLAPLLIDLMDCGFVTGLAFNGSVLIHDFETAYAGKTSEDVDSVIGEGQFGMAKETGEVVNEAISKGTAQGLGLGEALGKHIAESSYAYKQFSILAHAHLKKIPATVHVAIGTDIIHMHPKCDPAALGVGSHRDFLKIAQQISSLEGGVYINFGSAVILPEIFLKALTLVRNLNYKVDQIVTANFDFIQHYRARVNVVGRPTTNGGRGYSFTGHHEIMLPLLATLLKASTTST